MKIILCDVDNTIADIQHRLHYIKGQHKNYDAFFDACVDDPVIEGTADIIDVLSLHYRIVFVSGRPDSHFDRTERWLVNNAMNGHAPTHSLHWLYMRKAGDYRPDDVVKEELYLQILKDYRCTAEDIACVFDDRPRVIAMWKKHGLHVFKVGDWDVEEDGRFKRLRKPRLTVMVGPSGCLSQRHEYLTPNGWKSISEYSGEQILVWNNGETFFETPKNFIKEKCNKFYRFSNKRGISCDFSEEHRVPFVKKYNKDKLRVMTAAEIYDEHKSLGTGWDGLLISGFKAPKNTVGIDLNDEQLRLMVAICADGSFPSKTNRCRVTLRKERKILRLRKLLEDCKLDYSFKKAKNREEFYFTFKAPEHNKNLSKYWDADADQLKIIADEVVHWDGSEPKNGGLIFFSCKKDEAEFVQYVWSCQGVRTSISENRPKENHRVCYVVRKTASKYSAIRSGGTIEVVNEGEFKYCFETSTGFFITRCDGFISVTGNSGKSTFIESMHYAKDAVVSSDKMRQDLLGDWKRQDENDAVFQAVHKLIKARIDCGLDTVYDATNLKDKDRKALLRIAPADCLIEYIVINRSMQDKLETRGWRSEELLRKHENTMRSNLKNILAGDGDSRVQVHNYAVFGD